MTRPSLLQRLRHAVRYVRDGEQPPNPFESAWIAYWHTLGRTGDYDLAYAARVEAVAAIRGTQAPRPQLTLVGGAR